MGLISQIWWLSISDLCADLQRKWGLKFISEIISQSSFEQWNQAAWGCEGAMFGFMVCVFCQETCKTPFMPDWELTHRKITVAVSWLQVSWVLLGLCEGTGLNLGWTCRPSCKAEVPYSYPNQVSLSNVYNYCSRYESLDQSLELSFYVKSRIQRELWRALHQYFVPAVRAGVLLPHPGLKIKCSVLTMPGKMHFCWCMRSPCWWSWSILCTPHLCTCTSLILCRLHAMLEMSWGGGLPDC